MLLASLLLGAAGCGPEDSSSQWTLPEVPSPGTTQHLTSLGDPCQTGVDCAGLTNAFCSHQQLSQDGISVTFPNGFCMVACATNRDCPQDGICLVVPEIEVGACFRHCEYTSDCRVSEGYCCLPDPLMAHGSFCASPDTQHQGICAPSSTN